MKKILHVLDVNAPAEKVYTAITTQQGLSSWWTTNVKMEDGNTPKIMFRFSSEFGPIMQVTHLEKDRTVNWKCVGNVDNWLDNMFTFTLKDEDGKTHVTFTQDYATELSDDLYGNYNFNWAYFLLSLRQYLETGKGTPYQA